MVTASADGTLRLVRPADDVGDLSSSAAPQTVGPEDAGGAGDDVVDAPEGA